MTIRSELAEHPQLIGLLDSLLDVTKSSHPNIKLLTVLVNFATPKAKTAALKAPVAVISKPIEELKKTSTPSTKVRRDSISTSSNGTKPPHETGFSGAPVSEEQPEDVAAKAESSPASNGTLEERGKRIEQKTVKPEPKPKNTGPIGELDWDKLIEHVRKNHIAIYSVLSKCGHEQDGDTLRIYTGSAFYKKKLDDVKYSSQLADSIVATGSGELTIQTIPTPPPPKDKKAAAIAALMGGGEEVTI
jgi:hypothetical protein